MKPTVSINQSDTPQTAFVTIDGAPDCGMAEYVNTVIEYIASNAGGSNISHKLSGRTMIKALIKIGGTGVTAKEWTDFLARLRLHLLLVQN